MKPIKIKEIVKAVKGCLLRGNEEEEITSVYTDSREVKPGSLFVPLIGEKVDAHKFIPQVMEAGAAAAFTSQETLCPEPVKGALIKVDDTLRALQDFAAWYRDLFDLPIIGITGSVGKTTTKEMVSAALSRRYRVLKTQGNMNSQVGLSLMMFQIEEDIQAGVIEMGISEPGEMERLAQIAKPETALVTNIGVSHIGQLGTKENIRKEKLNIINIYNKEATLILNGDDPLLTQVGRAAIDLSPKTEEAIKNARLIHYGLNESNNPKGKNIKTENGKTCFTYEWTNQNGLLEREEITLSVLGTHNVGNAIAALSTAQQYGIAPGEAKKGLEAYKPIGMRGQIEEKNGIKIIDDTYNASPDSMKSGIEVLLTMEGLKRRIAVLADVLELGAISHACHYEVGQYIGRTQKDNNKVDILITVGEEARAILEGARKENKGLLGTSCSTNQEAVNYLKQIMKPGDGILVKGSRGMHMDEIVKELG